MAGTLTLTQTNDMRQVIKYSCAWTSTAGGAVSANAITLTQPGELIRITFAPGTGGTQPDAAYDVTVVDAEGADVAAGAGANLSNSVAVISTPAQPVYLPKSTTLDVVVANAGNAKTGRVDIYVRGVRQ